MKRSATWPWGAGWLWSMRVSCWRLEAELPIKTVYWVDAAKVAFEEERTCLVPAVSVLMVSMPGDSGM